MQLKDINFQNISSYVEGNWNILKDVLGLLPEHEKEQVLWRALNCPPECKLNNKCVFCGCKYPDKLYVERSCNKDKNLPNIMDKEEWEEYKKEKLKTWENLTQD